MEMMKLTRDELEELIKMGRVSQVHLADYRTVLCHRGSMKKNSMGEYILRRLKDEWESWTDPKYSDNPEKSDLYRVLRKNLILEVNSALSEFEDFITSKDK